MYNAAAATTLFFSIVHNIMNLKMRTRVRGRKGEDEDEEEKHFFLLRSLFFIERWRESRKCRAGRKYQMVPEKCIELLNAAADEQLSIWFERASGMHCAAAAAAPRLVKTNRQFDILFRISLMICHRLLPMRMKMRANTCHLSLGAETRFFPLGKITSTV